MPRLGPIPWNDGVPTPKDGVHMDPSLGKGLPHVRGCALSGRPKQAMRFPRVSHELPHGVVFRVVKGKVLEVGRDDAKPSQASDETSNGCCVTIHERPACTAQGGVHREPIHGVLLEAICGQENHARPRHGGLLEQGQRDSTPERIPQQVLWEVRQAKFVQPASQCLKQQRWLENWRSVPERRNGAAVLVGNADRKHRCAFGIKGQVVSHFFRGSAKSMECHHHANRALRRKQAPVPRPSFEGMGGGGWTGWVRRSRHKGRIVGFLWKTPGQEVVEMG